MDKYEAIEDILEMLRNELDNEPEDILKRLAEAISNGDMIDVSLSLESGESHILSVFTVYRASKLRH